MKLRAMKTVVAGAVGATCGEVNVTHLCPPPLLFRLFQLKVSMAGTFSRSISTIDPLLFRPIVGVCVAAGPIRSALGLRRSLVGPRSGRQ